MLPAKIRRSDTCREDVLHHREHLSTCTLWSVLYGTDTSVPLCFWKRNGRSSSCSAAAACRAVIIMDNVVICSNGWLVSWAHLLGFQGKHRLLMSLQWVFLISDVGAAGASCPGVDHVLIWWHKLCVYNNGAAAAGLWGRMLSCYIQPSRCEPLAYFQKPLPWRCLSAVSCPLARFTPFPQSHRDFFFLLSFPRSHRLGRHSSSQCITCLTRSLCRFRYREVRAFCSQACSFTSHTRGQSNAWFKFHTQRDWNMLSSGFVVRLQFDSSEVWLLLIHPLLLHFSTSYTGTCDTQERCVVTLITYSHRCFTRPVVWYLYLFIGENVLLAADVHYLIFITAASCTFFPALKTLLMHMHKKMMRHGRKLRMTNVTSCCGAFTDLQTWISE